MNTANLNKMKKNEEAGDEVGRGTYGVQDDVCGCRACSCDRWGHPIKNSDSWPDLRAASPGGRGRDRHYSNEAINWKEKIYMKTKILLTTACAIGLISSIAPAQSPSEMDRRHREMMPLHAKLMEKQKAQEAEIDKLLIEMNSAIGEKRIDAIIAVINKVVEQRREMQAEMASHFDR